ncbi:MAG: hypothetical protein GY853_00600 [PVC group bacterium]|nr:hypothetical protein [PVC group bacterium]
MIYNDGNGFYRAVMFSYLEYHILNKNLHEIKKFAYDFNNIIDKTLKGRNIQIHKNEFLAIMYIITELIDKNLIERAYAYFLKAYYLFESFDLVHKFFKLRALSST